MSSAANCGNTFSDPGRAGTVIRNRIMTACRIAAQRAKYDGSLGSFAVMKKLFNGLVIILLNRLLIVLTLLRNCKNDNVGFPCVQSLVESHPINSFLHFRPSKALLDKDLSSARQVSDDTFNICENVIKDGELSGSEEIVVSSFPTSDLDQFKSFVLFFFLFSFCFGRFF